MGKQRVKFSFSAEMIKEPVIYQLGRDFQIATNIRRADVGDDTGWVLLELDGEEEEIKRGLAWVNSTSVRVDPVSGDVIDG